MYDNYGISVVKYDHKEPIFLPFADKTIGSIHMEKMPTTRYGKEGTFAFAEQEASKRMNMSVNEVREYMKQNELTWHECADGHTIIAVPTRIHFTFKHLGGISVQQSVESIRADLSERSDGGIYVLDKNSPFDRGVIVSDIKQVQRNIKKGFNETKKELFPK